jgi:hypothetical protein
MGVPTVGALSLRNIARERLYGNYGGGGTITLAVAMYDLLNGGQTGGSGNSYPPINGNAGNVSPNGSMESWRGYCQNWIGYYPTGSNNYAGKKVNAPAFRFACPATTLPDSYWASNQLTNANTGAGWTVNSTILYDTNAQPCSGGTPAPLTNQILVIYLGSGATSNTYVETNSSGVITSITQC